MFAIASRFLSTQPSPLYDRPEETKGSGDYDETCAPLLNGKPEYVRLTSSPYDPAQHDTAHDDNSTHDTTPVVWGRGMYYLSTTPSHLAEWEGRILFGSHWMYLVFVTCIFLLGFN